MMLTRGGRGLAVTLAVALPSVSFAQQAPSPVYAAPKPMHGHRAMTEALQAANLRPDQQAHIEQLIRDEHAKVKGMTDKTQRKAAKRQLRSDILATMDPNQQAAFEAKLREIKAERKAAKAGAAP